MEIWNTQLFASIIWVLTFKCDWSSSAGYDVHDNVGSTVLPMLTSDVRSRIECATRCDVTEACASATVSGTAPVVCKLYSLANFGTTYSVTGNSLLRIKGLVPDTTTEVQTTTEVFTTSVTTAAGSGCPNTMTYNQDFGACLQLLTTPKMFAEGETICQAIHSNAHLVSLKTAAKQLAVNALADAAGVTFLLTSGRATYSASPDFVWSDTGEALTYTNWKSGEPNNNNGPQDCLADVKKNGVWIWGDQDCAATGAVLCEL